MQCKKCGETVDEKAMSCKKCGYISNKETDAKPISDGKSKQDEFIPSGKKNTAWHRIVLPVTSVVIVIAIIFGLYVGGISGEKGSWVKVPDVVGKQYDKADDLIQKSGLRCIISDKIFESESDENDVVSQNLSPKSYVGRGRAVEVVLSAGTGKIYMPNVEFFTKDLAKEVLSNIGFKVEFKKINKKSKKYDIYSPGIVCGSSLKEGQCAYKGDKVTVYLSPGEEVDDEYIDSDEFTTMINIVGKDFEEAREELFEQGIYIAIRNFDFFDDESKNSIVDQNIFENETVSVGRTVGVTVNLGKDRIYMPDVVYMKEKSAIEEIEDYGLKVKVEYKESRDVAKGAVVEQKVEPGTLIEREKEVTIVVSSGCTVTVPDVSGLKEEKAVKKILEAGLGIEATYTGSDEKSTNTVVSQNLSANKNVEFCTVLGIEIDSERPKGFANINVVPSYKTSENTNEKNASVKFKDYGLPALQDNYYWVPVSFETGHLGYKPGGSTFQWSDNSVVLKGSDGYEQNISFDSFGRITGDTDCFHSRKIVYDSDKATITTKFISQTERYLISKKLNGKLIEEVRLNSNNDPILIKQTNDDYKNLDDYSYEIRRSTFDLGYENGYLSKYITHGEIDYGFTDIKFSKSGKSINYKAKDIYENGYCDVTQTIDDKGRLADVKYKFSGSYESIGASEMVDEGNSYTTIISFKYTGMPKDNDEMAYKTESYKIKWVKGTKIQEKVGMLFVNQYLGCYIIPDILYIDN